MVVSSAYLKLGHRLGLLWYWMVCLGNEQRSFCCFWDCIQVYCISDSFVDHDSYSISPKGFLPTVVDIMIIWVKFTHSVYLSLLIPRMSLFTLAISCLTTSNLPWFMDLTFPIYAILLFTASDLASIPFTSTTWWCFCFGAVSSFFLELFFHWSPVAYWVPTDLGSSFFSVLSFCLFILFMGFKAGILKRFAIPFSSGPHFVKTLYHDPSTLCGPTRHVS